MSNNDHRIAMKDGPPSPSEETTCSSTVHSATSVETQDQQRQLRQQTRPLALVSGASAAALVVAVVPAQLLLGAIIVLSIWIALLFNLYQRAQLEYQNVLAGRGLGDYLPESWYDQLVNMSFHEWMVGGTFVQENQHFMLYFIPGITAEQLNSYVERLIPRHRRALQRPGLGNFLGPQFMRAVMGDERMDERQQRLGGGAARSVPRRLELETRIEVVAEGGDDDSSVWDENENPAAQMARFWGTTPVSSNQAIPRSAPVRSSRAVIEAEAETEASVMSDDEADEEEDLDVDATVVWDAVFGGVNAYSNIALSWASESARRSVTMFSGTLLRTTLTLGAATFGMGLLGVWTGYLNPQDLPQIPQFRLPQDWQRPSVPSRSTFISSTLASGATASLFMMLGWPGNKDSNEKR